MMKAIKNFMNKPVTWGDSFKWSGIVLGLYAAVIGACVAYEKWTDYKAEKEMLKKMRYSSAVSRLPISRPTPSRSPVLRRRSSTSA